MRIIEVALSPAQLAKRDNWPTFISKIEKKEPFELVPEIATDERSEVTLGYEDPEQHADFVEKLKAVDMEAALLPLRAQGKTILLPTIDGEKVKLSHLQKNVDFGRRGGKAETERQESQLVDAINDAVMKNKQQPITLKTQKDTIKDVISANKVVGTNDLGKEPYADIAIHTKSGKTYLISAKGTRAPSIAGGGIAGLLNVDESIVGNAVKRAYKFYKEVYGHAEGLRFPPGKAIEVFIRIADKYIEPILRGTEEMGGPIDYMYIGPMDVNSNLKDNVLTVNGAMIGIQKYMKTIGDLFIRIRRRRKTQVLDFQSTDKHGFPNIFYSKGEGGRRIVLVSQKDVPKNLKKKGKDMYIALGE